jgi:hypothetical protein
MKKLFVALCCFSSLAFAEDLKPAQEEAKEKFQNETEEALKAMNDKCGTKIVVTTDFNNFKEEAWAGTSYSSYCAGPIGAIGAMCEARPAYKKILAKKLTGVACIFAGVKPAEKKDGSNEATLRNMSFSKGVFTFHLGKDIGANLEENTKATIEKALN